MKPILTKQQADALEELKKTWENDVEKYSVLVKEKLSDRDWVATALAAANTIDDVDFIHALYVGYEVEMTIEEKLIEQNIKNENTQSPSRDWGIGYNAGWRVGVNHVLRLQGKSRINF